MQALEPHHRLQGGNPERAAAGAVAVVDDLEERLAGGVAFFGVELSGELGVGGVGVDDLQQPLAQDLQPGRVVGGGLGEEVLLRPLSIHCPDPRRQRVHGLHDHVGLVDPDPARAQLHRRRLVPIQRCRELHRLAGLAVGGAGGVREPRRCRRRPGRLRDIDQLPPSQHRCAQCLQPVHRRRQLLHRLRHRVDLQPGDCDRRVDQVVDHLVQPTREPVHRHPPLTQRRRRRDRRVPGLPVALVDCHEKTLRPTTDTSRTVRLCCGFGAELCVELCVLSL